MFIFVYADYENFSRLKKVISVCMSRPIVFIIYLLSNIYLQKNRLPDMAFAKSSIYFYFVKKKALGFLEIMLI